MIGTMPFDIDVPTKFITYATMSWMANELVPYVFHALGLVL